MSNTKTSKYSTDLSCHIRCHVAKREAKYSDRQQKSKVVGGGWAAVHNARELTWDMVAVGLDLYWPIQGGIMHVLLFTTKFPCFAREGLSQSNSGKIKP